MPKQVMFVLNRQCLSLACPNRPYVETSILCRFNFTPENRKRNEKVPVQKTITKTVLWSYLQSRVPGSQKLKNK